MRLIAFVMVLLAALTAAPAGALEPVRAGQENFLKRTIWSENRLWLLTDAGQLFTITADDAAPRLEFAGGPVVDMCMSGGLARVIIETDDYPAQWTLRHREPGQWVDDATLPARENGLQTLLCDTDGATLMTHDRLITVHNGQIGGVSLSGPPGFGSTTVMATDDKIFMGFNRGEFGGGFAIIDRATGQVEAHGDGHKGDDCAGDAGLLCGNINAFAVVPWRPQCVAMAVGLVHFSASGRIVQYCPNGVTRLYFKNYADPNGWAGGESAPTDPTVEGFSTVAFFGLMTDKDELVAAGIDGLYHLGADGAVRIDTMPLYKRVGPFWVNFDNPDYVLVLTMSNQRFSISGATPLLVPRDEP